MIPTTHSTPPPNSTSHHQHQSHVRSGGGVQQPPAMYAAAAAPQAAGSGTPAQESTAGIEPQYHYQPQHHNPMGQQRLTWRWVPTLTPAGAPGGVQSPLPPPPPPQTAGTTTTNINGGAGSSTEGRPPSSAMTDLYSSPMIPHHAAPSYYPGTQQQHFHLPPPGPYFYYGPAGAGGGGMPHHHQQQHSYHLASPPYHPQGFSTGFPGINIVASPSNAAPVAPPPPTMTPATRGIDGTGFSSSSPAIPAAVTAGTDADTDGEKEPETPPSPSNSKKRGSSSQASSESSPSKKLKKPKLGDRRSTEDLDAATLLASMMKKSDQQSNGSFDNEDCSHGGERDQSSENKPSAGKDKCGTKRTDPTERTDAGSITPTLASDIKWYHGVVSLHLPEDDDTLSPLHCFMRRHCVEAFSASAEDVATPRYGKSHGFKVEVGQVGLRCLFCKHLPISKRPERAVCYPSSLRNIYHSIETWQRRHAEKCHHISPWVRKSIQELMETSKTRAGGRRQYWEDSASRLGMADTTYGVRFKRPPGDLGPAKTPESKPEADPSDAQPVVREEDKDLVTEYLFLLMEQMQTCKFTEEDRSGGRSKIKDNEVGFPGMECRHCRGRAGFGRYFPTSVAALSLANSDRNVFNHLQKCRRCPETVKSDLIRLSKDQGQGKNRRGLRKLFFKKIWDRIHEGETSEQDGAKQSQSSRSSGKTEASPAIPSPSLPPPIGSIPHHGHPMQMTATLPHGTMHMHPIAMTFAAVPVTLPVVPNQHHHHNQQQYMMSDAHLAAAAPSPAAAPTATASATTTTTDSQQQAQV